MRDRNLTGPWAGFAFKGGRLVTPEGRELMPEDLAWLSLTAAIAREWRTMMEEGRQGQRRSLPGKQCEVVLLRDYVRVTYEKQSSQGGPRGGAGAVRGDQICPGRRSGKRG